MDDPYLRQLLEQLERQTEQHRAGAEKSGLARPAAAHWSSDTIGPAGAAAQVEETLASLKELVSLQAASPPQLSTASTAQPVRAAVFGQPSSAIDPRLRAAAEDHSVWPNRQSPASSPPGGQTSAAPFSPRAPRSWSEAGLKQVDVEPLALKLLLTQGALSGRDIAETLRLPFSLLAPLLAGLKTGQWVAHKGSSSLGDYVFQLTPSGADSARQSQQRSSYCGPAPVSLEDYIASVKAQSVLGQRPDAERLAAVFQELVVNPKLQNQIGQAVYGGLGFFLYGAAGNGKTSIAERISLAFGATIWIPLTIWVEGDIIRLFDPCKHVESPLAADEGIDSPQLDKRWVRIRRPTIVAGGELTLEQLEIAYNPHAGVCEAPLQLKSNCGTLLIDDFGRQRVSAADLLNRWIVPLERRHDYLNLPRGKTIQAPFDQLLIFSTNLEPRDLVDEAFLRRLPYKIEIPDPTESEFRELFRDYGARLGVGYSAEAVDHLIARHYRSKRRPYRFCQARDLTLQVRNYCGFNHLPLAMTPQAFDAAALNYFALMG